MTENQQKPRSQEGPEKTSGPSYTPASFEKRAAAWMGLGYALFLLFIITFAIFTGGKELPGTFPLLLVPVSLYAAAVTIHRQRAGTSRLKGLAAALFIGLCAVATGLGLALGAPALVDAIQNAYA